MLTATCCYEATDADRQGVLSWWVSERRWHLCITVTHGRYRHDWVPVRFCPWCGQKLPEEVKRHA